MNRPFVITVLAAAAATVAAPTLVTPAQAQVEIHIGTPQQQPRNGAWGDRDRDGIPNAYDPHNRQQAWRDRDHDGVPNLYDRDRDGDGCRISGTESLPTPTGVNKPANRVPDPKTSAYQRPRLVPPASQRWLSSARQRRLGPPTARHRRSMVRPSVHNRRPTCACGILPTELIPPSGGMQTK